MNAATVSLQRQAVQQKVKKEKSLTYTMRLITIAPIDN
jgi:hypothetical protein